ncbi:MAG: indole-3-glycerol phosphate synthase TrpC [Myxococcales bacterium]|nr:indole-3-glycerol phosphate synthase TrpC [Myxococcales bacterium]
MTILDKLLADKRDQLANLRGTRASVMTERELTELGARLPPPRDFIGALRERPAPGIIAEFKRASPSAGVIREGADPRAIASEYAASGARCISVLTDRNFQGSLEDLRGVRQAVSLPILCKDFILERWQILEAKRHGADAVLLIVAALEAPHLRRLLKFAHSIDMQALCEAHDAHELDRAMAAGARLVGVNARDLETFDLDLERVIQLRREVPESFTFVAESGIRSLEDAARMRDAGVDALLIGTHLMQAERPGEALRALVQGL